MSSIVIRDRFPDVASRVINSFLGKPAPTSFMQDFASEAGTDLRGLRDLGVKRGGLFHRDLYTIPVSTLTRGADGHVDAVLSPELTQAMVHGGGVSTSGLSLNAHGEGGAVLSAEPYNIIKVSE